VSGSQVHCDSSARSPGSNLGGKGREGGREGGRGIMILLLPMLGNMWLTCDGFAELSCVAGQCQLVEDAEGLCPLLPLHDGATGKGQDDLVTLDQLQGKRGRGRCE